MSSTTYWIRLLTVIVCFMLNMPTASAIIFGGSGNKPVHDAGWPSGSLDVANLKTRIAWWEGPPFGGGQWHFEYRGSTADLQAALDAFSKILAPRRELVIHSGTRDSFWLKTQGDQQNTSVDWEFVVWVPANWNHLYNDPRSYFSADQPEFRQLVAAPQMNVHLGDQIDWDAIKVPSNVSVSDLRLEANGFSADEGGVVQADVWDMNTGKPIPGARLLLSSNGPVDGKTDANGRVAIERIAPDGYQLSVSAEGYAPKRIGWLRVAQTSFIHYDVYLSAAQAVDGLVVDADGQPLVDVKVRLSNTVGPDGRGYPTGGESTVMTDADGKFSFPALPKGVLQFACYKEGYYYNSVLNVHNAEDSPLTLKMVQAGNVEVQVIDANGDPINEKFIVELAAKGGSRVGSWGGSSNVSAEGTVHFRGVPPGEYEVWGKPNPGRVHAKTKVHALTIRGNDQHTIELQWIESE